MKTHLFTGLLCGLLFAPEAGAAVCHRVGMPTRLPVLLSRTPGDFGAPSPACAETWFASDLRADLVVDVPDFYGNILGEGVLSGAIPLSDRAWISASVTALRYRQVINASVISSDLSPGLSTLGVHGVVVQKPWVSLALYSRVLIPTNTNIQSSVDTGLDAGVSLLLVPHRRVSVNAGVSLPLAVSVLGARARWTFTPRLMADVAWSPARWIELLAGFEARAGASSDGALETFAPKAAVRVHPGREWMLNLQVMVPVAGLDQSLVRGALGVGFGW